MISKKLKIIVSQINIDPIMQYINNSSDLLEINQRELYDSVKFIRIDEEHDLCRSADIITILKCKNVRVIHINCSETVPQDLLHKLSTLTKILSIDIQTYKSSKPRKNMLLFHHDENLLIRSPSFVDCQSQIIKKIKYIFKNHNLKSITFVNITGDKDFLHIFNDLPITLEYLQITLCSINTFPKLTRYLQNLPPSLISITISFEIGTPQELQLDKIKLPYGCKLHIERS
ncbi:MAG: hypothetical protein Gaeavirus1_30 [Gaeavirus sp.]|uniref:Uncharacterized protein n=1 Tax=Gaeavirus sp. TaxID=2487767 RepID=A0A3G5A214_9VIRU|nr:MAG: hypothetical protein Gaeavirus1_30 [Gaeavirus sp.]